MRREHRDGFGCRVRRTVGWARGYRAHTNAPSMLELADIFCPRAWARKAVPTLQNRRAVGWARGYRAHANAPSMRDLPTLSVRERG
ncbi:MAG: hypothetical protein ACI8WM_003047 [Burkholderiaceae bacterium]|jgi:hypothetical protein